MGVNDSRDSIKEFIWNWSKWPSPIALKRSQDHERPHFSVLTYDPGPGEIAAPVAGLRSGHDSDEFEVLEYDDLDAMIDDGWEID